MSLLWVNDIFFYMYTSCIYFHVGNFHVVGSASIAISKIEKFLLLFLQTTSLKLDAVVQLATPNRSGSDFTWRIQSMNTRWRSSGWTLPVTSSTLVSTCFLRRRTCLASAEWVCARVTVATPGGAAERVTRDMKLFVKKKRTAVSAASSSVSGLFSVVIVPKCTYTCITVVYFGFRSRVFDWEHSRSDHSLITCSTATVTWSRSHLWRSWWRHAGRDNRDVDEGRPVHLGRDRASTAIILGESRSGFRALDCHVT